MKRIPLLLTCVAALASTTTSAATFYDASNQNKLQIEVLKDDLIQLEWAQVTNASAGAIVQSPMINPELASRPAKSYSGSPVKTATLSLKVNSTTLCVEATDIRREPGYRLTLLCPQSLRPDNLTLSISRNNFMHVYGLGQQHPEPGTVDGDWAGKSRVPSNDFGNEMVPQGGGAVGNMQIPIAYFLGEGQQNYGLFVDNTYAQRWDFTADPYLAKGRGNAIRAYLIGGRDLPALREGYLQLTGRPPVPPKKMFGLWLSEYSFDNWDEIEQKLMSMQRAKFPVDGVFLDVAWFGGVTADSEATQAGSMRWDNANFPNPERAIQKLDADFGAGVMAVEQPYVGRRLPEYLTMSTKGYLVRQCPYPCDPIMLRNKQWWGWGAMLDYSNEEGAAFWHDWRRESLIKVGVIGHWTTLGEPENYDTNGWYHGVALGGERLHGHADIHNLYNLLWSKSIYEGYGRNGHNQRPFVLTRSGTAGSQRYGTAFWSGDIGSNLSNLASHLNTQMQMSLSGIDYYSSDIGGFHRQALRGEDLNTLYTRWLAVSAAIDVPLRVHVENLCNCNPTTPNEIGDAASNLANLRQRYALTPYYYSLAHLAWRSGEPVVPPMVYYYQDDPGVRQIASQKMIGRDMLVATVTDANAKEAMVYLPEGEWVDYYDQSRHQSKGAWAGPFPLYRNGIYRLPTFVRAGAVIPELKLDAGITNSYGLKQDKGYQEELLVTAYLGTGNYKFTLFEDDNVSMDYQKGRFGETDLVLKNRGNRVELTVSEGKGRYEGVAPGRNVNALFITRGEQIKAVTNVGSANIEDVSIPKMASEAEFKAAQLGWWQDGNKVWVKIGPYKREFVNHINLQW